MPSPRDAVREAMEAGFTENNDIQGFIKDKYNREMRTNIIGRMRRSLLDSVDIEPKGTVTDNGDEVKMSGRELARVIQKLVQENGLERVRDTLDIVEELTK